MYLITISYLLSVALILLHSSYRSSGQGLQIKTILSQPLTAPAPDIVATVVELKFPPGDVGLGPHYHSGPVVGYVIEGEFLFQMKGDRPRILKSGEAFHENDGQVHIWGANASNETECKVVVTVYGRPGENLLTVVKDFPRETRDEALALIAKGI